MLAKMISSLESYVSFDDDNIIVVCIFIRRIASLDQFCLQLKTETLHARAFVWHVDAVLILRSQARGNRFNSVNNG